MWAQVQTHMPLLDYVKEGGVAIAIIIVVVLFLRALKEVVTTFTTENTAARHEYTQHMTGIMNQGLAAHQETRDAIRSLEATLSEFRRAKT